MSILFVFELKADEIKHEFKSPSFSGIGTSSHYLTIENQEFSRKEALKAEIKAMQDALKREEENTTLARFIKNFESRIYAQLSRQLVDQLFGENPATEGSFTLFDNLITWTSDGITHHGGEFMRHGQRRKGEPAHALARLAPTVRRTDHQVHVFAG